MDDVERQTKLDEIEAALRPVGLYLDRARWMERKDDEEDDEKKDVEVVMVGCLVGDLAFTNRVQNPKQYDFDASFRELTSSMTRDEFEETRKRLAAGEDDLDL